MDNKYFENQQRIFAINGQLNLIADQIKELKENLRKLEVQRDQLIAIQREIQTHIDN